MIEISFGKLLLLAIIALIVLGPEKLPHAARTAGALLRRVRTGWDSVRAEVEREVQAEEIKRNLREAAERARQPHDDLRSTVSEVNQQVRGTFTEAGDVMRGKPLGDGRQDTAQAADTPVDVPHVDAPRAETPHVSSPAAPMDPEGPDVSK
ncbi:Sec-independent protein translocase protein TatB [Pinirhizobacter soli]|uniref:Sec-independent protein translocase protein TatB n=1 Tax=Pinirhizobacter soli TaxID=2786953 RepID=UPI002029E218|nr:Sec-independent protein translocase protein TatB [Pinirhizobacter soli]